MSRTRVTYTIPPPSIPIPLLALPPLDTPRHGRPNPLIIPAHPPVFQSPPPKNEHPKHRLGVASLALDSSTSTTSSDVPGGILYSGGRDGMVIAWDLGVPHRKRRDKYGFEKDRRDSRGRRWEVLTGWEESDDELEREDEVVGVGDGDILGDVTAPPRTKRRYDGHLDDTEAWEVDSVAASKSTVHAKYQQHTQSHSDWVNDLLLINSNQTLLSASSDTTIKAWSPHQHSEPTLLGTHSDYVRTLSTCPTSSNPNIVASGSFDHSIKLWDPAVPLTAISTLQGQSSIYALAHLPSPSPLIASGGPEKIIRLWDPKSGKAIGKLVGHSDLVRTLVGSWGGEYLLSAGADTSIKLWSLKSPSRCLHTFSFCTESVWTLESRHPRLEVFYSGDRAGNVVRVDAEGVGDLEEGYGVLLGSSGSSSPVPPSDSQNNVGITNLLSMDDTYVWSASGQSEIACWSDSGRRTKTSSRKIPYGSMVRLDAPASVNFIPSMGLSAGGGSGLPTMKLNELEKEKEAFLTRDVLSLATPLQAKPIHAIAGAKGLTRSIILSSRLHALSVSTAGEVALWDLMSCTCLGYFSSAQVPNSASPRERLELVRERIEGECVVASWCVVDTKVGELNVIINVGPEGGKGWEAECFGDELPGVNVPYDDEYRVNIPRWILTNLFRCFLDYEVKEQARSQLTDLQLSDLGTKPGPLTFSDTMALKSPAISSVPPTPAVPVPTTPKGLPATLPQLPPGLPSIPQSPVTGTTPEIPLKSLAETPKATVAPPSSFNFAAASSPVAVPASSENDYFSLRGRGKTSTTSPTTPDDFGSWGGTGGTGFMSRLRPWRRRAVDNNAGVTEAVSEEKEDTETPVNTKTPLQLLLSSPLTPPSAQDAPALQLAPGTKVAISDADGTPIYRSLISELNDSREKLENDIPLWLAECVLASKVPVNPNQTTVNKVSFVLMPWKGELPVLSGSPRLTASRYLRARKVSAYVQEKLDGPSDLPPEGTEQQPPKQQQQHNQQRPEELYEILCHDTVVPWYVTLAAVKQFVWRQTAGDLTLHYRRAVVGVAM